MNNSKTIVFCLIVTSLTLTSLAETPAEPQLGLSKIGQELYESYCTSCHGKKGRGDGPVAEHLVVAPPDLTKLTLEDGTFPLGEVMMKIDGRGAPRVHGSQDMPIWGDALGKAEGGADEEAVAKKITALGHFLWSIQSLAE